ncbi:PPK2 family polyphosphate kinase [Thermoflavifilum thermophilum]|uniref:Polyphosphate:nucleotide phosphotransferase, PPK2 family n=1 Tax=Thermoflavifilum thermophilum TaxID=1393122 RepID=A0A1I7N6I1_9BACT|nr:PPK2 family polyphosphate kinase [Thermoflavifilum thermophilum]SFV30274.1 polyphosphate:nucleotide phosphotransferase, PPK2 family [Thermoflavifilum thermophilum]
MSAIRLTDIPTRAPGNMDKKKTRKATHKLKKAIADLQNILYAEAKHSLLVILQGMDASGKDGAIRHVFNRINPQGIQVTSFKVPTPEEAAHDFLWRIHAHAPARGMMHIFNRSHYEDVLVTRVHGWIDDDTAHRRMQHINHFEQLLLDHQTTILKFYLHISREEQAKRLQERLKNPKKRWKYNPSDLEEAQKWHDYLHYYEEVFATCSPEIPWIIVPADQNWYKEFVIAEAVHQALKNMQLRYPRRASLASAGHAHNRKK